MKHTKIDPEEMYQSGMDYREGKNGKPEDQAKALECFIAAAELDHVEAQYMAAMSYEFLGPDGDKNRELAREWLIKAADAGHKGAISELEDWHHAIYEESD